MIELGIEVWTKDGQEDRQRKLFKTRMEALTWGIQVLETQLGAVPAPASSSRPMKTKTKAKKR